MVASVLVALNEMRQSLVVGRRARTPSPVDSEFSVSAKFSFARGARQLASRDGAGLYFSQAIEAPLLKEVREISVNLGFPCQNGVGGGFLQIGHLLSVVASSIEVVAGGRL